VTHNKVYKEFMMKRATLSISIQVAMIAVAVTATSSALARTQTVFPKATKILRVIPPPQCNQFKAPQPDRRTDVAFPSEAPGIKGDAALLLRIGQNGEFLGVVDFIGSDDAYIRAAEASVKDWTFKPAVCNGAAIASEARVDFEFRREGGVTYGTGTALGRK
jgi:hypothetical protein